MHRALPRAAATVATLAAALLLTATPAQADYYAGGMPTPRFTVAGHENVNPVWRAPMDASLAAWNTTSSRAWITRSSSSKNRVLPASYSATWYGYYVPYWGPLRAWRTFDIKLNARTISRDATNWSNFVRHVYVHELGHALSLRDNPNTTSTSIMKYDTVAAYNWQIFPTAYDVAEVNRIYGR